MFVEIKKSKLMNDNLENQLAKVIEKSLEIAEKTGEFVIDQAPELLREFYLWHTINNILGVLICLLLFLIPPFLLKRIPETKDHYSVNVFGKEIDDLSGHILVFGGGLIYVIGFPVFLIDLFDLIQILTAPKIYLIENLLNR